MKTVVLKFGGTSVGSIDRIKKVCKIIAFYKKKKNRVLVVTSAMSGVTNELINKSKLISNNFDRAEYDALISTGEQVSCSLIAGRLKNNGFKIYSDGTDTHLMLVDLRPYNVKGNLAAESLSRANITCNKNGIPFDTEKPMITSGIRLGTQAATTRGFGLSEFKTVGELITKTLKGLSENPTDNSKIEKEVKNEVIALTSSFPIYKNL